jgi:hypothetical protein
MNLNIQTSFPKSDAVFQYCNTAMERRVRKCLKYFTCPAQAPYVNTTEIFCSILRTRMKKGLPFAIFVKQI